MFKGKQVYCFIPARGGSKGIKGKNIKKLNGKPLIVHSIDTAKDVKLIDKIFVSTENIKIKKIAERHGTEIIDRPKKLAEDDANFHHVLKHMIKCIPDAKNAIIVIFWPTTPIRNPKDIEKCIKLYNEKIDCVISVIESKIRPSWLFVEQEGMLKFWQKGNPEPNRQQQQKFYYINGGVVVTSGEFLMKQKNIFVGGKIKKFIMDEKHSMEIDTEFDFQLCEFITKSL